MGKRLPYTPNSQIRNTLRRGIWLRSRERAAALKKSGYSCCRCHKKQSKAKGQEVSIEVHHINEIDWEGLIDLVRERMLSGELECLCKGCHEQEHIIRKILKEDK